MSIEKVRLLVSAEILSEFNQVAERPKLRKYVSSRRLRRFNQLLIQRAEVAEVRTRLPRLTEDPDDNKILEAAVDGKADYMVSGDKHLLSLRELRGVRIVNVGRMLELLGK